MDIGYQRLARIFNSNILNDIASGDLSYVHGIVDSFFDGNTALTLPEIFDESFKILSKNYPNEYIYKNLIANKILMGRHSLKTATMLTEFRVGKNKADCVILNGKSVCYEIKTDYDSLMRLDDQLFAYSQLFDEVNVVCSYKHVATILEQVPLNVGVMILSDKLTFQDVRKASSRIGNINKSLMMQSLRKNEYIELVNSLYGEVIDVPNTQIFDKCFDKIEKINDDNKLSRAFVKILKKHRKNNDTLIRNLPKSLANAAISYKFNKNQSNTLIKCFNAQGGDNVLSNFERKIK